MVNCVSKFAWRLSEQWPIGLKIVPIMNVVLAVAKNTTFSDLPSVQAAIVTIAKRPFDRIAADTLQGKFSEVLPQRFETERVERGVHSFLEFLREEFASVPALRDAIAVGAEIQTARATQLSAEALVQIEALLKRLESRPAPTEKTLQDYLLSVIDQQRYLDPRGTMQTVRQVQVLLQDIYVSLEAEAEELLSAADRRLFEQR